MAAHRPIGPPRSVAFALRYRENREPKQHARGKADGKTLDGQQREISPYPRIQRRRGG